MHTYSYIVDQLLERNSFFAMITVVYMLVIPQFLFLTSFWFLYLSCKMYMLSKYYKSTISLIKSYTNVYGQEEELQNNINKAEYYNTMWYKTFGMLLVCVSENISGVYIIISLIIGPYYSFHTPTGNITKNCSDVNLERRMNYMLAMDAPSFLIPVGVINGLIIYLNNKYAFYNKSHKKLYYQALVVILKVAVVSILALIPSIYTFIIAQVALSIFLFFESLCYIIFSRKLVVLLRARNLDLKYEEGSMRSYLEAEQSVDEFRYYTRISHVCGGLILLTVLFTGIDRIIRITIGNLCYSPWSSPTTFLISHKITAILYYPISLSFLTSGIVFLIPYTLVTLKYIHKLYKKRNETIPSIVRKSLREPLLG